MYRGLRADEIELRVGGLNKAKTGFSLLCYKDARCDQNILDEVHGSRWQRDHKEVKGNLYGGVGVWDEELNQWIWRWDCGTESNTEGQKGEASDSFKRACFNLGIGRELYTSPFIWIDGHVIDGKPDQRFVGGLRVSLVEYEETESKRIIKKLQIKDKDGVQVFGYGIESAKKPKAKKKSPEANGKMSREEVEDALIDLCEKKKIWIGSLLEKAGVAGVSELTDDQLSKWIDWVEAKQ